MAKTVWENANGTVTNVTFMATRGRAQYTMEFAYDVDGQTYRGKFYSFKTCREGDSVALRYDLRNPAWNNFSAAERRKWRIVIAVGTLVVVFAAALVLLEFYPK